MMLSACAHPPAPPKIGNIHNGKYNNNQAIGQ